MGRTSLGVRRQMNVRLPPSLIEELDASRGMMSRDLWVERAIRNQLHPISIGRDPELLQRVHEHSFDIPSRTVMRDGQKHRVMKCECGTESV